MKASSRVVPQEFSLSKHEFGIGFFYTLSRKKKGDIENVKRKDSLQNLPGRKRNA